ncbi:MAG TPA: helix-turn-helix transcriptional regulator [Dehalococcoidia bacterium]|nr:helix-turn-helix transcriptional regulator [Dehalococcoidia bacterium]
MAGTWPRRPELSQRERDILDLLALGLHNREIAAALRLSAETVNSHVDHILTKLGLRTRTEAAVWWAQHQEQGKENRKNPPFGG